VGADILISELHTECRLFILRKKKVDMLQAVGADLLLDERDLDSRLSLLDVVFLFKKYLLTGCGCQSPS
jgi:hypothetical protein